jgi:hypothetical protein
MTDPSRTLVTSLPALERRSQAVLNPDTDDLSVMVYFKYKLSSWNYLFLWLLLTESPKCGGIGCLPQLGNPPAFTFIGASND